ncbi:hypothetical protein BN1708_020233, partial [Verticillium longisporum]
MRVWHFWQDKIRQAIYKAEVEQHYEDMYTLDPERATALRTGQMAQHFFPETEGLGEKQFRPQKHMSSVNWINDTLA